jgi:hypothetical protein
MLLCKEIPENTLERIMDYIEKTGYSGYIFKDTKGYGFIRIKQNK